MKNHLIGAAMISALVGCSTTGGSEERQTKIANFQRTIPTCSEEKVCAAKWEAAQLWVVKNAHFRIQTATNVLIQTYNSVGSEPGLAAQITKEPMGGGRYRFVANVWCGNMFGCVPDRLDALLNFNMTLNYVMP